MSRSQAIVVTGAAGFIGSNIIKALNERGQDNLVIVDVLKKAPANGHGRSNLDSLKYAEYMNHDRFLEQAKNDDLKNIQAIIHMGACADTGEQDWEYLYRNNVLYSKELFHFCARNGVQFLYASSAATYGDGSKGYRDMDFNLQPLNLYGRSKHEFDLCALAEEKKPPQWVGFKFFNVYGPHESHKGSMASVAYHGYNQIMQTGKLRLFRSYKADCADGGQKRDFLYVNDAVDTVLFFLDHREQSGIFNIGTGKARTFNDLASALFSELNKKPDIEFIDMPGDLRDRYQYFTEANIAKLREAGYRQEFIQLEEGVAEYAQYLSSM